MSDFLSEQHLQIMRNHAQRALRDNSGNLRDLANDIITLLQELEEVKLVTGAAICGPGMRAATGISGTSFSSERIEDMRRFGVRLEVISTGDTRVLIGERDYYAQTNSRQRQV